MPPSDSSRSSRVERRPRPSVNHRKSLLDSCLNLYTARSSPYRLRATETRTVGSGVVLAMMLLALFGLLSGCGIPESRTAQPRTTYRSHGNTRTRTLSCIKSMHLLADG